tara:strand:+ start:808 stop:990 length:183 start_codon:yes stop_codon:yes gene_type:complete
MMDYNYDRLVAYFNSFVEEFRRRYTNAETLAAGEIDLGVFADMLLQLGNEYKELSRILNG